MPRLTIRLDFDDGSALGPGKVRLLELVAETGSIRKAAGGMKMSYRKAWLLLKALEETFGAPVIAGGPQGAKLTSLGQAVARRYRSLEKRAGTAARQDVRYLVNKAMRGR
jgi:molybdate transport system regulatory protein